MDKDKIKTFTVTDEQGRIDKFLASVSSETSRSELKKYFDEKLVLVNNQTVKPSYAIKPGDVISLIERPLPVKEIAEENIPLDILYEDEDVLVVNKPSGMVVHPAFGHSSGTLVNALMYHSASLSNLGGVTRSGIVHRIDKDTSGLLVVCKNNFAHRQLSEQFKQKTSTRKYLAICYGVINHNLGRIDAPIGRHPTVRQKMAVVENGKPAVTHFKVLERFKNHTLVELTLETGRTHQIRVHMAYIGHPLLGDPLYGPKKVVGTEGQFLHAKNLGFSHPRTKQWLEFDSELPESFKKMLEELRKDSEK
ncbi:MAG TPA: RluA family pseudouridine synthase [Bacilli bacterium]|jgi:23S rRNA pseudouridine1911/1915/1917 synthase|nr:RluA family pseudouridine synthase [Acholeplasmataceae bacterium]OQB62865.1 MAG: Ribosomal large subunit pseudouridine synthase D [Tenericutes bacterium ADurb.Bin140]HON63839.1 RluA family pseudouridine synthase [Bacilli bacterium]HOR95849.1 RluA family pseudouridine synthase [Bacilli bacterium]HPD13277.1 RluA family pseudouridine synthase [Bacilli bacterium]